MSNKICHPFHLVDESPWPLIAAIGAFSLTTGFVGIFSGEGILIVLLSVIALLMTSFQWWRDVSREGVHIGFHTGVVELGLRWGIILFIVSEVFFFLSFFWCYFHISLSPRIDVGRSWRPAGIEVLDPFMIPLLNTLVLVRSGVTVTWAHHRLIENNYNETYAGLIVTCLLGFIFTLLQGIEYLETRFTIADRVYGSVFFIATGFHGVHVIVGTLFLIVTTLRLTKGHLSANHHFGFEASAWYWHFVDVVWLFLYVFIYWWGAL